MKAKQNVIGMYVGLSAKNRIDFLIKHYVDIERLREAYKDWVVDIMIDARTANRNRRDNLGVRVQTSNGISDITFCQATERILFDDCFKKLMVTEDMFPDPYEYELINLALFEWDLMKREYENLRHGFKLFLDEEETKIIDSYFKREKLLYDIADEYCIEPESANKRVYRIRKKLVSGVIPRFKEYNIKIPA